MERVELTSRRVQEDPPYIAPAGPALRRACRPLELEPYGELPRPRRLDVLQLAEIGAGDVVAAEELLSRAGVGDVEDVDTDVHRRPTAERELPPHAGVPGLQPRRPQLTVGSGGIGKARGRRQRVGDRTAIDDPSG